MSGTATCAETERDLTLGQLFEALFSPEARSDPYPFLRRYRGPGTSYRIAHRILRDPRFGPPPVDWADRPFWLMFSRWLISLHGEQHERMRALASRTFARHSVSGYEDAVLRTARRLLDEIERTGGPADLVTELNYPLPVAVICSLLGLPEDDCPFMDARLRAISSGFANQRDEAFLADADRAVEELSAHFEPLLLDRRTRPRDDLLSTLGADDIGVPFDIVVANVIFLAVAGHETTMNTIGSCVALLLDRPDQLTRVREHPDLIPDAIDETLRFESPVQHAAKVAREPADVEGLHFEPGDSLDIFIGAVNRDPAMFTDPDRFDVGRVPNPHLAFTAGAHYCLGAPLARLEATIAVRELLSRFPDLHLAGQPEWHSAFPLRGLAHLPVEW